MKKRDFPKELADLYYKTLEEKGLEIREPGKEPVIFYSEKSWDEFIQWIQGNVFLNGKQLEDTLKNKCILFHGVKVKKTSLKLIRGGK